MDFEIFLSLVVIPFCQSLIYDLSKVIFSTVYHKNDYAKGLDKAIKIGVSSVLDSKNKKISSSITQTIQTLCTKKEKVDIYKIVEREISQWGEQNIDVTYVSSEISKKIVNNIIQNPDLNGIFSSNMILNIIDILNQLQNDNLSYYNNIHMELKNVMETHSENNILLHEIFEIVKNTYENCKKTSTNSAFILDEYKSYFLKPLFLEKNSMDNKIATLKDVYVENRYRILDFPFHNKDKDYTDLINFIKNFICGNLLDKNYCTRYSLDSKHIKVLFIKGQPGSGKSSLFYYLAYLKSTDPTFFPDNKFYFVKLIDVYDEKNGILNIDNPIEDIEDYIGQEICYSDKNIIVLDGLDEICVAKNLNINEYCTNLIRIATSRRKNLRIIITTRLNYVKISHENNKNAINIQLLSLSVDELKQWSDKYFEIHKDLNDYKKISEQNIDYLQCRYKKDKMEIFTIPLLFYMIVKFRVDISKISSIGELYDVVFDELKERNYNESDNDFKQKHLINKKIPLDLARQIAMEISLEMYRQNRLLLNINSEELKSAIEKSYLQNHTINESDKKDIEKLFPITFFYKTSDDVVEFAHKSIMEFFVAEKLYQQIDKVESFSDYIKQCILNPAIITNEVLDFLTYFINNRKESQSKLFVFENILSEFKNDVYMKTNYETNNINYTFEISKIIFKIYWYFIREIIKCEANSISALINEEKIKLYIVGVLSIHDSGTIPFLDNSVNKYNFSDLELKGFKFEYCDLSHMNFTNATFTNCEFKFANLISTIFTDIIVKEQIEFNSCCIQNVHFLETKKTKNKVNKQDVSFIFSKCDFNNTSFENINMCKINFHSITSMNNVKLVNVKVNYTQFLLFNKNEATFKNTTIVLQNGDFSTSELKRFKQIDDASKRKKIAIEVFKEKHLHENISPEICFDTNLKFKDS